MQFKLTRWKQSGFSLVELMVAMLVGLVILGAIIQVFVSSKKSYLAADDSSLMNDNSRYILTVLNNQLRMAGHLFEPLLGRDDSLVSQSVTLTNPSASITFDPGTFLFGTATDNGNYDTLYMRFQGSSAKPIKICGVSANSDAIHIVRYSVTTVNYEKGPNTGVLSCLATNGSVQNFGDHIDMFRVLYGIDTDGDSVTDKYVSANKVLPVNSTKPASGSEWQQVVSLKIGLLLRSNNPIKSNSNSETYQVLDKSVSYSDAFARKVVTSTISLRNRLP
ncbi:MAG: PilW family protein [Gammaproteobacteria bacterium]|nr:PilW family protein [Gammaproteobacteria bacterium]